MQGKRNIIVNLPINEQFLKEKYEEILDKQWKGYSLVSLKFKNFRSYCHLVGHEHRNDIISKCESILRNTLHEDEWMVHLYSCNFLMIIRCDSNEEALHASIPRFHGAIRDGMNTQYGRPLYLEVGYYPIGLHSDSYYQAEYFANLCRVAPPHNAYPETNYDMYYISYEDQNEKFSKLESKVHTALSNGHFKLFLQPKVDAQTLEVTCAEALMRWIDPEKGMIPLQEFLPNIEENGSIRDVDLYLFDKGCSYIEKWKKQYGKDIQISFNLSGAYFNGPYFIPEYREVFERYDIEGKNICIELLESIVLNELEKLHKVVDGIHQMGFHCALDDFGSGFSSFDILTNISLSELKLDRSLFLNYDNDKEHILLKYLVDIAHTLDMRVVAEGIENKEYAQYMRDIGCDLIQGYYYFKPMPVEEFEQRFLCVNDSLIR